MLGTMLSPKHGSYGQRCLRFAVPLIAVALGSTLIAGQSCTTQAKMSAAERTEIGSTAYKLASAVQRADTETIRAATIQKYVGDFSQTAALVRTTSADVTGDTLAVTHVYLLDATSRTAGDNSEANFTCPLVGTTAETEFAISGLPPGRYAFVMVEASGPHPWLLSFLLQAEQGAWKIAGFYQHPREVAGHNGLWYWTTARANAKDGKEWLSWALYGEADQLLRPANFATTTNLDRLRSEERSVTPSALAEGLSARSPLVVKGPNGAEFRITGLSTQASEDAKQLNLVMHLESPEAADQTALTARSLAAATALMAAHPELRSGFDNLWIVAEVPGGNPFVTVKPMAEIGQGK